MSPAMQDDAPARWAALARAFQDKIARLPEEIDPRRLQRRGMLWSALAGQPPSPARARACARLFRAMVAPWPPLERLQEPHTRLALLPRDPLLRQLGTLALARRSGVLRCCIDRRAREALREFLGDRAFDILRAAPALGRGVPEGVAQWGPAQWSCVGYLDWVRLVQPADQAFRRLVRLSLPPDLLGMEARSRRVPGDVGAEQATSDLQALGLEWSC